MSRFSLLVCVLVILSWAFWVQAEAPSTDSPPPAPAPADTPPDAGTPPAQGGAETTLGRIRDLLLVEGIDSQSAGLVILDITAQAPVTDLDEPRSFPVVMTHNPDLPLSTASVMKLYTTAASLHHLKPEYVFTTDVYAEGEITDGVLKGDLRVVGGGDPFLVPERLMLLVQQIRLAGVRHLTGRILTDTHGHDAPLRPRGWEKRHIEKPHAPPVEALSFGFNLVSLHARAEGKDGDPVRLEIIPALEDFRIENTAKVGGKRNRLSVTRTCEAKGKLLFHVSGTLPAGRQTTLLFPVEEPARFFGLAMLDEMRRQGITMDSKVVATADGPVSGEPLVSFDSPPLSLLTRSVNLFSNNMMAELILRQMGGEVVEKPGNEAKGLEAVRRALTEMGLDPAPLDQRDGSGLTQANRTTARLTALLLARMALRPDIGPEFVSTLSANGATGTLETHLADTYYRRIRGKTGFINEVFGLAGYIHTKNGRLLAYCLLLNKVTRPYRETWDTVIDQILVEMSDL